MQDHRMRKSMLFIKTEPKNILLNPTAAQITMHCILQSLFESYLLLSILAMKYSGKKMPQKKKTHQGF